MPSLDPSPSFRKYELREHLDGVAKRLLASQRAFVFAPERQSMFAGGFASGKTYAMLLKALVLSAAFPGNRGALLCYHGSDAEKRLVAPFLEEVCPPEWRKAYNKNKRILTLRNNSVIEFSHIKDSNGGAGTGTRRIGASWGFFGVDQAEEITPEHWDALLSRLRLPRVPKKFAFGTLNPAGKDWIFSRFFQKMVPWPRDDQKRALPINGKFFQELRPSRDVLGVVALSEENRISNGGFIEDNFYDNLLETYGEAYIERFLYTSFEDFKGSPFEGFAAGLNDYADASVHMVDDFQIPKHWECLISIDVGGDSPWSVIPVYADERGNLIVANGFHNRTTRVMDVANWIKRNTPWNENRTRMIIDPENPIATVELNDYSLYASPAKKDVMAGILRLAGYLHIQKHKDLPQWYLDTQPQQRVVKFNGRGSPSMFIMKSATVIRKEIDTARWDPEKPDRLFKSTTARFDCIDALRYAAMEHPEPSKAVDFTEEKYRQMEKRDPATAREWRAYDQRIAARKGGKGALRDMDSDESSLMDRVGAKYDWNDD